MSGLSIPLFSHHRVVTSGGPAYLLEFELGEEPTTSEAFAEAVRALVLEQREPGIGVVISGRGPIWGYGMLLHKVHPFAWVAVYDPKLVGGVVVQTHLPGVRVGQVVTFSREGV